MKPLRALFVVCLVLAAAVLAPAAGQRESPAVTLTFWYPYGEGSWTGKFLASKIQAFNQANPGITVQGQSYENYAAIIEALQRAAAAKSLPGVATIAYGYDDYIIGGGLAAPLNELLGADSSAFLGDFFPSLLEITTVRGKTYGLPLALSVAEVFYHSDLFAQAGLDPDRPPAHWEDFLEAARAVHGQLGVFGATFALDDPWTFETAVRSNGGDFLSADGRRPTLDSAVAVRTLEQWAEGVRGRYILYNAGFFETLQSFGAQQAAMFAVSSYGTLYYKANLPAVRAMPWPAAQGHPIKSPAGGNSLYVFGNTQAERRAGAEFLRYLTGPEANAEWAMNSGYLPTRRSSLERMGEFIEGFDNYRIAVAGIQHVVAPVQFPGRREPQIRQVILEAIEAALLGRKSAREALAEANAKVAELMKP